MLSELENRLEGLGTGVQDVLRLLRGTPTGMADEVHGVVADLFHVDVDSASLVEVALGERTQFIVLSQANRLFDWLGDNPLRLADRVGFLSLDGRHTVTALDHVDLVDEPGVMGRADRFVETAVEYQPLVRRLLGRTWLVDRLSTALRLSQSTGRGLEFVTSDGEFLAADGALIVGPRKRPPGCSRVEASFALATSKPASWSGNSPIKLPLTRDWTKSVQNKNRSWHRQWQPIQWPPAN